MLKEIERKYLVTSLPADYKSYPKAKIEQYYLSPKNITLRIRKVVSNKNSYFFTIKYGKGAVRTELEPRIPKFLYDALTKKFAVSTISKTRYKVPYKKCLIELDIYKEHPKLVTAEVEFNNMDDYNNFEPPSWFGKDVSKDPEYKNKWLAVKI